jgi:hypothetical protein
LVAGLGVGLLVGGDIGLTLWGSGPALWLGISLDFGCGLCGIGVCRRGLLGGVVGRGGGVFRISTGRRFLLLRRLLGLRNNLGLLW